ncbi:MAG: hypothetical protein ACFB10_09060, partial [Salibacteraceae bacterium]
AATQGQRTNTSAGKDPDLKPGEEPEVQGTTQEEDPQQAQEAAPTKTKDTDELAPAEQEQAQSVYHVKGNQYAQSVLDEINPQYFNEATNRYGGGFYVAEKGEVAVAEVYHHGVNLFDA